MQSVARLAQMALASMSGVWLYDILPSRTEGSSKQPRECVLVLDVSIFRHLNMLVVLWLTVEGMPRLIRLIGSLISAWLGRHIWPLICTRVPVVAACIPALSFRQWLNATGGDEADFQALADSVSLARMRCFDEESLVKLQRRLVTALSEVTDVLTEKREQASCCCICQDQRSVVAIVPCGHRCLCRKCWERAATTLSSCPVCRSRITHFMEIR